MGVRTNGMLAQDFPKTSSALLQQSNIKFDYLINEGFLGDHGDFSSIESWLGPAMTALAETFVLGEPTFTGTAGTTSRYYAAVPTYPLEFTPGGAQNAGGKYLNFLGGKPPYGYPAPNVASSLTADGVRRLYGKPSALKTVAATAATLDGSDYVTITAPAAENIPGVKFDLVSSDNDGNFFVVALGVAPGATALDKGPLAATADPYYGRAYVPRTYAEVGIDTTVMPSPGLVVYGWLTR